MARSKEDKQAAVAAFHARGNKSVQRVAKAHRVSTPTLYAWVNAASADETVQREVQATDARANANGNGHASAPPEPPKPASSSSASGAPMRFGASSPDPVLVALRDRTARLEQEVQRLRRIVDAAIETQ